MKTSQFNGRDLSLILSLLFVLTAAMFQRSTAGITLLEIGLLVAIPGLGVWGVLVWRQMSSRTYVAIPQSMVWLLLLGLWSVGSIFPAVANGVDIISWGRRLFPFIVLVTVALVTFFSIRSREHLSLLYSSLIGVQIVAVLIPLIGLLSIDLSEFNNLQYLRNFGKGQHGGILISLLFPALVNFRRLNTVQQAIAVFGFVIGGAGLLISFSRTMWIATAAAVGFTAIVYLYQYFPTVRTIFSYTVLAVIVVIFMYFLTPDRLRLFFLQRARSIPNALQTGSFQDRLFELRGLLTDAFTDPLMLIIGHGWGAEYSFYSVSQYSWGGIGWTMNAYSHNYYGYLLWSIGAVGLFFFLRYCQLIFRDGIQKLLNDKSDRNGIYLFGCMAAVVSLLVSSLTAPLLYEVKWAVIFAIVFGIITRVIHGYPSESGINNDEIETP